MKKLFTLTALLLLMVVSANAQVKKTWDFSKGWSDETVADIKADTKNWFFEYNEDGSWKTIKENTKLTGDFIANGNYIKELIGLSRGTAGLSKNNNYLLTNKTFRLNRDKQEIIFPKLVNGQTITIKGKSANATAENRGIKPSYDYIKQIEGPEDCLVRASLGEVTLKWRIETDSPDSVDVKFAMITGGVDFTLFMIDEGDIYEAPKVAYIYNGTEDVAFNVLSDTELYKMTPINITNTTITAEQLQEYDVTVISNSVPADNAAVSVLKEALPWTPVLNLNAQLYPVWGYGEAVETSPFGKLDSKTRSHDLYEGLADEVDIIESDGVIGLPIDNGEVMTAVKLGDYFAGDPILATSMDDESLAVIHLHNINHNGYIFMPGSDAYTDGAIQIIRNAIAMLKESKAEITPAKAPVINIEYKDMKTNVTILASTQPKAKIYYTTDGTEPTTESTEYTGMFTLNEESTVKAVAIAEGYTLSEVAERLVDIKSQPKTPVISWTEEGSKTTVKISGEGYGDDVKIWYNFADELTTDTLKSTLYVDSIPVVITMPQNVTAFAVAGGAVWSEVAQQRVLVQDPRVVIDVASHFAAKQWTADNNPAGIAPANGKGMFSWGASAATMYTGAGRDSTIVDPETGDETTITIYSDEDLREYEVVNEPTSKVEGSEEEWIVPDWKLKSRGTCLIWQNTTPQTSNFGDDNNYNPMYSTDVDPLFPVTKNDIQFYKFYSNEPGNGSIETNNKYQAPFDVVVLANMAGGPLLVQVSADGENWQTIGEIAKSGKSRMWSKYTMSYDGLEEVYARVTQEVASGGAKIFDIYIANAGENSQKLLEELKAEYAAGIQNVEKSATKAVAGIYTMGGVRVNQLQSGLNIVVSADGNVKKVLVK